MRPSERALTVLASLLTCSFAAACDGLIGLTDPTVDAGAQDAAAHFDAADDADDSSADTGVMEGGVIADVGVDAGEHAGGGADSSGACMPKTCEELGYNCGFTGDGCGNAIQCGACKAPEFCGGGGPSVCGGSSQSGDTGTMGCVPTTCFHLGYDCGVAGDGCGNILQCGTCEGGESCGGGGINTCGGTSTHSGDGSTCVPQTCAGLGFNCGAASDGCGGTLQCGTCTAPETCLGGGIPGQCGGGGDP